MMASGESVDSDILDAARASIIERGLRRTTLAEVARVAGVTRPTVYARHPGVKALARHLMTREISEVIAPLESFPDNVVDLVDVIVEVTDRGRSNEMLCAVIEHDPEFLVMYQFKRLGESQWHIVGLLEKIFAHIHQMDSEARGREGEEERICLREADPHVLAMCTLMTAQSAALFAHAIPTDHSQWRLELAAILKGYLYS